MADQIDDVGDDTVEKEGKILFYYLRDFRTRGSPYDSFDVLYLKNQYKYIGRKLHTYTSISNIILIDVAPSTSTNRLK
jgi:hypothetical protein